MVIEEWRKGERSTYPRDIKSIEQAKEIQMQSKGKKQKKLDASNFKCYQVYNFLFLCILDIGTMLTADKHMQARAVLNH